MKNLTRIKHTARFLLVALFIVASLFILSACKDDSNDDTQRSKIYDISFSGNLDSEHYNVGSTTWTESTEEGFDAVYTLTEAIPYNKEFADSIDNDEGFVNFALIRFTSDIKKVAYNPDNNSGFYAKITNFYGTDNQTVEVLHDTELDSGEDDNTYLLYQGIDTQIRTMTVEISFDGSTQNARIYKFIIDPTYYGLSMDIYTVNFEGNRGEEIYNATSTFWDESYEAGFDGVFTLVGVVPYNLELANSLGYTDGRVNFALIRFYSPVFEKVAWNNQSQTGITITLTNNYGTGNEQEVVRHDDSFTSGEDSRSYLLYQGIDNIVRTMTVEISFDGTLENTRIYKFIIDPANYSLETEPMIGLTETASLGDVDFTNDPSITLTRLFDDNYILTGTPATMTAEQAEAFYAGVAGVGEKYVILNVKFSANSTIKYGFVANNYDQLGEVVEGDVSVKSFESGDNTSEDFILTIGLLSTENKFWRVEVIDESGETTVYTVDMSQLFD